MLYSKTRPIVIIVAICMLLGSAIPTSISNFGISDLEITPPKSATKALAYSSHSPIVIRSNSDFESQDWPGQGSSSSPYLISNFNITSDAVVCILIANTSSYFIIRNCWLSSEDSDWSQGIITLDNVANGRVENNHFASGHIAIRVEDSSSCIVTLNTIGTSLMGFLAYNIHDCEFTENSQISDSMGYPVHIEDSSNVDITDNFFQDCLYEGIGLTSCTDCYVASNTLSGTDLHLGQYGFAIRNSRECTLTQNNIVSFGTAIDITDGQLHTISMNYINSCWGGISVRGTDITISNNEITVTGFSIQLRVASRITVDSNILHGTIYATGIDISGGTNCQVSENIISDLDYGMRIQGIVNLEVSDNIIFECFVAIAFEELGYAGIDDGPPVNCRILSNQLVGCGLRFSINDPTGMNHEFRENQIDGRPLAYLYEASNLQIGGGEYGQIILADCENVTIEGGTLDEVLLMFCTNCVISNVAVTNGINGIYIRYSSQIDIGYSQLVRNDVGIRVEGSNDCHIISITAHNNSHGILLDGSPNSMIYDCDLFDNEYGIVLIGAHNSYVDTNRIFRNRHGIYLLRTEDSYIGNNEVIENIETGLLLNRGSRFNTIIANSFGWNNVNVLCTGVDNIWDDGVTRGNSWSDLGDSIIYKIDEDDFDRYPRSLQEENSPIHPGTTTTGTNSTEMAQFTSVAVGAVAGFSLLGLFAVAVNFVKRRNPI